MASIESSAGEYIDNRIAQMQAQMRSTPPIVDQQEVIASQKALSAAIEQLSVAVQAIGTDNKAVELLEKSRDTGTLTLETMREVFKILESNQADMLSKSDEIKDALLDYVSDSTDKAIQARIATEKALIADQASQTVVQGLAKNVATLLEMEQERQAFAEDEKRVEDKKNELFKDKVIAWGDKVLGYLEKLWERFRPKWEDVFKILWALFADKILHAFRWGVEHFVDLLHLKFFPMLKPLAGISGAFSKMAHAFEAIARLEGKWGKFSSDVVTAIKSDARLQYFKAAADDVGMKIKGALSKFSKETQIGRALSGRIDIIKASKAYKDFEVALAKTSAYLNYTKDWGLSKISKGASKVGNLLSKISGRLAQGASAISNVFNKMHKSIKAYNRLLNIADRANIRAAAVSGKIGQLTNWWAKITGKLDKTSKAIGKQAKPLGETISRFTKGVAKATKFFRGILRFAQPIAIAFDAFFGAMRTTGNWFDKLRGAIANVIAGFVSFAGLLWNVGLSVVKWVVEHIPGMENSPLAEWLDNAKMSDMFAKQVGANMLGLSTEIREDGKIGYTTLTAAGKSQGGGWNNVKAWFSNFGDDKDRNYNEDGTRVGEKGDGEAGVNMSTIAMAPKDSNLHKSNSTPASSSSSQSSDWVSKMVSYVTRKAGSTSKHGCGRAVGNAVSAALGEGIAKPLRGDGYNWASSLRSKIGQQFWDFAGIKKGMQVANLPAGSILSWPKNPATKNSRLYGHVEIADGKGNLISDFKRPANGSPYGINKNTLPAYVFTPKGTSSLMSTPADKPKYASTAADAPLGSIHYQGPYMSTPADKPHDATYDTPDSPYEADPELLDEQEERYSMANAIQDIIKLSAAVGTNAEADAIYGRASKGSTKSAPAFGGGSSTAQSSTPDQQKSAPPVIALQEQPAYNLPQIDDQLMMCQQMALPTG